MRLCLFSCFIAFLVLTDVCPTLPLPTPTRLDSSEPILSTLTHSQPVKNTQFECAAMSRPIQTDCEVWYLAYEYGVAVVPTLVLYGWRRFVSWFESHCSFWL